MFPRTVCIVIGPDSWLVKLARVDGEPAPGPVFANSAKVTFEVLYTTVETHC